MGKHLHRAKVHFGTDTRGKQELENVQNQLLEIVRTFRHHAGVEDHPQAKRTPRSAKRKTLS